MSKAVEFYFTINNVLIVIALGALVLSLIFYIIWLLIIWYNNRGGEK